MKTLLSIKIKEQFFKKTNLIILLIVPLIIASICAYVNKESRDTSKVYNAAIIDNDKTKLSLSLIEDMREYKEIELYTGEDLNQSLRKLTRGKYDVVYEIKKGFQDKILRGEFYDILAAHKEVNSTAVKWLNDQVSLMVMRDWLYIDVLDRIHSLNPDFNEVDFKQKFERAMADNKILSIKIQRINRENTLEEDEEPEGSSIFRILWGLIIIFLLISFGKKVVEDRERAIIVRLELSGISKMEYYLASSILPLLNVIIPFTISYFIMSYMNLKNIDEFFMSLLLTTVYSLLSWIIIIFIGFIFSSKRSYSFVSQVFLLLSIIFGTGLLGGMFKLIDYVSWIFPFKWYIYFNI